jgi:adenosylcobinamide-GDP ribazoletransferase
LPWFPVVGALIGLGVGMAWWIANDVWDPWVGAAVAIVADLALTGMLHHDGLGDAADGLLPHLPPERRLEVMREPDIGAYGVAAIGAVLLLQLTALASMPHVDRTFLVALYATTRGCAAVVLAWRPYARPGGLAEAFRGTSPLAWVVTAVAVIALAVDEPHALLALPAFAGVIALGERKLGGYTGDVLGAAILIAQTVALLAASA